VDRAKAFYMDQAGFEHLVDHSVGEDFRVVQLTPRGSTCSIAVMKNAVTAGSVQGLHLVVSDIDAARLKLLGRGVQVGEIFHFEEGVRYQARTPSAATTTRFYPLATPTATAGLYRR